MKQYRNLKQALKDGYKIHRISFWQYINQFEIVCYPKLSCKKITFYTCKIPSYIKKEDISDSSMYKTIQGNIMIECHISKDI